MTGFFFLISFGKRWIDCNIGNSHPKSVHQTSVYLSYSQELSGMLYCTQVGFDHLLRFMQPHWLNTVLENCARINPAFFLFPVWTFIEKTNYQQEMFVTTGWCKDETICHVSWLNAWVPSTCSEWRGIYKQTMLPREHRNYLVLH